MADENSKRSRVDPVFGWLKAHRKPDWPLRLLRLADGLQVELDPGRATSVTFETAVLASQERLDWLVENVSRLGHGGELLKEVRRRSTSTDGRLRVLEGTTYADCLIECERAIVWIEGKRHDWLSAGTKWDPRRDQLARNVEAAWLTSLAHQKKEFFVLLCHEAGLSPADQALVDGYRSATLTAGLPHVEAEVRAEFAKRIGTVTWSAIVGEWPEMRRDPRLKTVSRVESRAGSLGLG